ncbi:uncharacterized protein B0H64DRAFT_166530 [Chaetomium fimeti]|jgi:hypothetical protein|uniref:PH domain-containing protein n=1 Tax=Chaetomium fimeti TaxID=1854472 RepID=A0AAE0HGY8_9PEZI|nr:hypothetical protein B0H64DRAFT_166530 [Chaetomium fimeti]
MNVAMKVLTKKAFENVVNSPNSKLVDSPNSEKPVAVRENGKTKMKKGGRDMPPGLSENDKKILRHVRRKAYKWDQQFRFCCCGPRFGWSAVIGLIPLIGDGLELLMSLSLIRTASKVDGGLPGGIYSMMVTHIILDFAIGFIPVLGDFVDVVFRANTRNAWLLESYLTEKGKVLLSGVIRDEDEDNGTKIAIAVPKELRPQGQDVEQGVEPMRMVEQSSVTPTAVPPAWTPAPKGAMPPPGRNLTGRNARDPRDR